jgi:pilus assembly protein FimV
MGLAALLLALLALIAVRRKRASDAAPTPGAPVAEAADPDVSNNSVFNSTFAESSSQIDTDEVDPVAEADVYIAYGREAQAEEILKEALRTHPERHPVRLKLLEIYAAHQDTASFQDQASQLHRLSQGSGDEWDQAAAMGLAIDPLNPLYASAAEVIVAAPAVGQSKTESLAAAAAGLAASASARDQIEDQTPAELDLSDASADERAGLTFEQDIAPAEKPVEIPAQVAQVEPSDIDVDFPTELQSEPEITPEPQIVAVPVPPAPAPAPVAQPDASLDFDFDLLPDFAPEPTPEPAPVSKSEPKLEPKPESKPAAALDPVLDLDLGESEPAPASAAAADFDLSGITLDLNKAAPEVVPEPAVAEEALSALAVEMDTKLDLAVAYQEIGDKEGARELLDEVIKAGSKEQIAKAVGMLAQIG